MSRSVARALIKPFWRSPELILVGAYRQTCVFMERQEFGRAVFLPLTFIIGQRVTPKARRKLLWIPQPVSRRAPFSYSIKSTIQ